MDTDNWPLTRSPRPRVPASESPHRGGRPPSATGEPTLFDVPADAEATGDPREPAKELRRLSRQCDRILDRLRRGPATNRELATIALKYTGRISDLRNAGYVIDCEIDRADGLARYRLASEPDVEPASRR